MIGKILILLFIVSATNIHVDDDKVKVIRDWPKSKIVSEGCSFYESTIFYRRYKFSVLLFHQLLNALKKKSLIIEMR
jgi:hypothetical protein